MDYKEGWIIVNKIPTKVITWGCWIDDLKENKEVIFVFSGNPGIPSFYKDFLGRIYENLNIPIWIVSYAGFDVPDKDEKLPLDLKWEDRVYTLEEQIDHKFQILQKYLRPGCKLYTICHSVGSYMNLEIMKRSEDISEKIQKSYLLFPMIERMIETDNGQFLKKINKYILNLGIFLLTIFQLLPRMVRYYMASIAVLITRRLWSPEPYIVKSVMQFLKPNVLHNMHYLGMDEMQHIKKLDVEVINRFKKKLKFYYGTNDGWCPIEYYEHLIQEISDIDAIVCNKGIEHAFILKSSRLMADIVSEWFISEFKLKIS